VTPDVVVRNVEPIFWELVRPTVAALRGVQLLFALVEIE
jgi:hypothetical protein